jgi:5'-nucleotidase
MSVSRMIPGRLTLTLATAVLAIPVLFLTAPTSPAAAPAAPAAMVQARPSAAALVNAQILAINDFHGNLESDNLSISAATGTTHGKGFVPAGGAAYLAAKINAAKRANPASVVVSAGDLVGGSPMLSGYYHDEPTIETMNQILDVATLGNHEFDEGSAEMRRLAGGGCHPVDGCQDRTGYAGAKFELLAANTVDRSTGEPVLPGYTIKNVGGAKVGFIGTTTAETPHYVNRKGIQDVAFLNEVSTIRALVPQVRAAGADAVVVLTHSGAAQTPRSNINTCRHPTGSALSLTKALAGQVDAVISAHTHQAYICKIKGTQLTSGSSYGRLLTTLKLTIDTRAHRVTRISAKNAVVSHELKPAKKVQATVARYRRLIAKIADRTVGHLAADATRNPNPSGETVLGNLYADSQLRATSANSKGGAQLALLTPGLTRTSLDRGRVTYREIYASQPFGMRLTTMTLTGRQVDAVLETQLCNPATVEERVPMAVSSGFTYSYAPNGRCGQLVRIQDFRLHGKKMTAAGKYRITIVDLLADGESGFDVLAKGTDRVTGILERDAAAAYLTAHPKLKLPPRNRITLRRR